MLYSTDSVFRPNPLLCPPHDPDMSVLCILVAIAYCPSCILSNAYCFAYCECAYCFAVHIVHFPIQILTLPRSLPVTSIVNATMTWIVPGLQNNAIAAQQNNALAAKQCQGRGGGTHAFSITQWHHASLYSRIVAGGGIMPPLLYTRGSCH